MSALPTQGTLGRIEITGPVEADTVSRGIAAQIEAIHALQAERQSVDRLRRTLDRVHEKGLRTAVPAHGFTFVRYSRRYTYWSNSNLAEHSWRIAVSGQSGLKPSPVAFADHGPRRPLNENGAP